MNAKLCHYTESGMSFQVICDLQDYSVPKGYISTTPIDGYENACLHVRYADNVFYDATGKEIAQYCNNYFTTYKLVDVTVKLNCLCATYDVAVDPIRVYLFDYTRWYLFSGPGFAGYPPSLMTRAEVAEWLVSHGFTLYLSGFNSRQRWSNIKIAQLPDITPQCATRVSTAFLAENDYIIPASQAFFDGVSALKIGANHFQTIAELAQLAKACTNVSKFANDLAEYATVHAGQAVDKAADLWLKYRYAYSTTKADVEEIGTKLEALSNDSGIVRQAFSVGDTIGRLKIRYYPYANNAINRLFRLISQGQRFGFDLSLYNVWDSIPFSFVVDWFVPIGDNLEAVANRKWAATMPYQTDALCSLKGKVTVNGIEYQVYTRFDFEPSYDLTWISNDGASESTWAKRVLDVVSLSR